MNRSIVFGTLGGIVSGFLPGVGSSEIATLATVDKNDHSFLITIGALTTANMLLSILSLYLINQSRSGLAVVIEQLAVVGMPEVIFIVILALISVGVSAIISLYLGKYVSKNIPNISYTKMSLAVIALIVLSTIVFTGIVGLFLLILCTSIGVLCNMLGVKRGTLMGVLILPTILFYMAL